MLGWCAARNLNVTLVAAGVGLRCLWNDCEHKYVCDGATINALAFEHIMKNISVDLHVRIAKRQTARHQYYTHQIGRTQVFITYVIGIE